MKPVVEQELRSISGQLEDAVISEVELDLHKAGFDWYLGFKVSLADGTSVGKFRVDVANGFEEDGLQLFQKSLRDEFFRAYEGRE